MKQFLLKTAISMVDTFKEFLEDITLTEQDLILADEVVYSIVDIDPKYPHMFPQKYGKGEPTDKMISDMKADMPKDVKRIIAIGGGTVIDIAKVLILSSDASIEQIFMGAPVTKDKELIVIPTTCGTGSEVTNITIAELTNLNTKKGLALDIMYPNRTVLIPEMLKGLPYKFFATSSIDALIHCVESYMSPKANAYTEMFSVEGIKMIIEGYKYVLENGQNSWTDKIEEFLIASNYGGIAFGNAGCAAVHALSYPLGGTHHIPHGEANQLMFMPVFNKYKEKVPVGKINQFEQVIADILECESTNALNKLEELLDKIIARKPLKEYGMTESQITEFSESVIEAQQRLLNNNYVELTLEDIKEIYTSCW
ncbi:MAG: 4-hydroxybutyrate dehydrogenase [Epulopiscium sp. Nuni2H_MBin003]|nr:MAG: 4-hydroxybutyrate dehydrogenase [Epulopiscium sp. Nuni2H_MBin003]